MGGGGGLPKLAPELDRIVNDRSISLVTSQTTEQLALQLSGKFAVSALGLQSGGSWPGGNIGLRLVVDGEVIWDSQIPSSATSATWTARIYGTPFMSFGNVVTPQEFAFLCESSLQLFITVPSSTTATLKLLYNARPIK